MLEIKDLRFRYSSRGPQVIDGVSLSLKDPCAYCGNCSNCNRCTRRESRMAPSVHQGVLLAQERDSRSCHRHASAQL